MKEQRLLQEDVPSALRSLDAGPEASKGFVERQEVQDRFNEFTQPSEYQVFVFLRLERKERSRQPAPSWGPSWFVLNLLLHQRPFAPEARVSRQPQAGAIAQIPRPSTATKQPRSCLTLNWSRRRLRA